LLVKTTYRLLSLAFVVVPMLLACGGQAPESQPSSTAAPASGSTIGVPECDEYLSKVEACIAEHVPDDMKAMQQQTMATMRDQWRQAAQNETAKASLAAGCKAALDAAKSSMASYGCEW
jgi:hypothetical protein